MKFAYRNGIMKGLSAETIDPLSNTPREQAIILLLRTYKNSAQQQLKQLKRQEPSDSKNLPPYPKTTGKSLNLQ